MRIDTKQLNYKLWQQGLFGNSLKFWNSIDEIVDSGYRGLVCMRYKGKAGGGFYAYSVPIEDIPKVKQEWMSKGAKPELVTYNEDAQDHLLLIQGEIMQSPEHYTLTYSTEKLKMRDALKKSTKTASMMKARSLLEKHLDPASYEQLQHLLNEYPGHIIEFSTWGLDVGDIPGRNTVFWEVRDY